MGLIAARPEEPDEWMGIPSEPRDVDSRVDGVADTAPPSTDAVGLLGGGSLESIVIPIPAAVDEPKAPGSTPTTLDE